MKRADLATPRGIDHDYNYLTSLERQLDTAERDARERGIVLDFETSREKSWRDRGLKGPPKGGIPLEAAIKRCRVVIDRAPDGMSRRKQNRTHWSRKIRCVFWTVEWVHKNGSRDFGHCGENQPIGEVYAAQVITNELLDAIKHNSKGSQVKRYKFNPEPHTCPQLPSEKALHPSKQAASARKSEPVLPLKKSPKESSSPWDPSSTLYFYLLLPSTPTQYRVLIPIDPTEALSTILTDRLILEFPTIYALKQPPDKLPTGFVNEEQYLMNIVEKDQQHMLDTLKREHGDDRNVPEDGEVNEDALLNVLKQDIISEVH
ncbi:MAG: hypothetical protein Q9214_003958 [Letrouitia sp. 1 TL-2023]